MIAKKNPKLQQDRSRGVYFQLGLLVVGASVLMAFTWKTPVNNSEKVFAERVAEVPEIEMVIEKDKPIEIPKVKKMEPKNDPAPVVPPVISPLSPVVKNKNLDPKLQINPKPVEGAEVGNIELNLGPAPKLEEVVTYPDKEATFDGVWNKYLSENIVYPSISQEWGDEGTVFLAFVVERDGSITDVHVKNKDRVAKELQKEAIRVVKASPKWNPGVLDGEYVRTHAIVKVRFILKK